ncbi:MAG: transaldolase, partial [Pyrinomonadaceae bacterium]
MSSTSFLLGHYSEPVERAIKEAETNQIVDRIWRKDASLWKSDDAIQKTIRNALGWLTVAEEMVGVVDELHQFAQSIRAQGFRYAMVCGMGGSSLCPEVLARVFGPQQGYPELVVLDSTNPDVISRLKNRIELERCLFIIASKSGSTIEPTTFTQYWYDELRKRTASPGRNFVAITDAGSPLVATASELNFEKTFLNQADIG